jgi:hypothetical protein
MSPITWPPILQSDCHKVTAVFNPSAPWIRTANRTRTVASNHAAPPLGVLPILARPILVLTPKKEPQ